MPDEWLEPAGGPEQWRDFNKYKDGRRVAWICNYVDLLDNDDYLNLTDHQRSVLHGFWLTFASARAHVALNTRSLSSRLNLRVMRRDIEALQKAGFVRVSVTKPSRKRYGFVTYRDAREGREGKDTSRGVATSEASTQPRDDDGGSRPNGAPPPSQRTQAETLVRNALWQDPHRRRHLHQEFPDLADAVLDELDQLAATIAETEAT